MDLREFVPGRNWSAYLDHLSHNGTFADHPAILATAHMLQVDIAIITSSEASTDESSMTWVVGKDHFSAEPLLLGHIWENHYQSLDISGKYTAIGIDDKITRF